LSKNYYYLVASLPYLRYEDKPPLSSEEFRAICSTSLSEGDAALLPYCCYDAKVAVDTVQSTGSAFVDFHILRERTLNLNLAFLRSAKLKRPSPAEPPHDVPRAEAVAKAAFEMEDPLEAETYIDRNRWGALDDVAGTNYFGVNNIFAYLLKLQLLERKQHLDTIKGFAAYKEIYDAIKETIPEPIPPKEGT
jgi:hypothetical protein